MHYIPYFQIRRNAVIYYEIPSVRPGRSIPLFKTKAYSGKMTTGSSKRIIKAVDVLLQKSPKKWTYNPVTKRHFYFDLNFVTLTVSDSKNIGFEEGYNNLLKPFLRKLRRSGKISYIWKAEFQKRGQLHYHITTNRFLPWSKLRNDWNQLQRKHRYLDKYALKHGHFNANSTDVHAVYKIKDIGAYLCKYLAKAETQAKAHRIRNSIVRGKGKVWDCSTDLKIDRFSYIPSFDDLDRLDNLVSEGKAKRIDMERCSIFKITDPTLTLSTSLLQDYNQWRS